MIKFLDINVLLKKACQYLNIFFKLPLDGSKDVGKILIIRISLEVIKKFSSNDFEF